MAGDEVNFKVCSPLKLRSGLKGKYHAICHCSYNLPLPFIIKTDMRQLLTLIIAPLVIGCSGQSRNLVDSDSNIINAFTADSIFIRDFKLDTLLEIQRLNNPEYGRNEQVYSLLKEKARYFEIKKIQLENDITGRIVSADFPSLNLDGIFKILFLVTYDKSDNEIDGIRLAKYELVSDVYALETGEIKGDSIVVERKYSTIEFTEKKREDYIINKNGKIKKITNGNNL